MNFKQRNNKKKDYQNYLNRWQLVKDIEEQEIRMAPFELLFKQTLSIWDIGISFHFIDQQQTSNYTWADLQKTWIKSNARE